MSNLVYAPPTDFFINVSLINLETCLNLATFEVEISDEKLERIENYLEQSSNCNIICFPEFTYNDSLYDRFRAFSDEYGIVIIGGSGLEQINDNQLYAYCPVFFPNKDLVKVYKRFITIDERTYSQGRLISYPNFTQQNFKIINQELEYVISIYICYDFLQNEYPSRTDVVFVPQLEGSPRHFINRGNEIVQGYDNFVFGINNFQNQQRSIGFANLNNAIIRMLTKFKLRKELYQEANNDKLAEHHTIVYDLDTERILKLRLNLAKPVPKPYNFSYQNYEPNIMLIQ